MNVVKTLSSVEGLEEIHVDLKSINACSESLSDNITWILSLMMSERLLIRFLHLAKFEFTKQKHDRLTLF